MKKFWLSVIMAVMLLGPVGSAQAVTLSFDDLVLGGTFVPMPNLNYQGFTWDSRWFAGSNAHPNYDNAAHSGSQFLSNGFGVNNLLVSRATSFDFNGAWFAHPNRSFNIADKIQLFGLAADNTVLDQTAVIDINTTHQFIQADFEGIHRVRIQYTDTIDTDGVGWFVMDDFVYDEEISNNDLPQRDEPTNVIPEPASLMLFGAGLVGLMRRRKNTE